MQPATSTGGGDGANSSTGMDMPMPTRFSSLVRAKSKARTSGAVSTIAAAGPRERKSQAALSADEQQRFLKALDAINQPGSNQFGSLVAIHADMRHNMHNMGDGTLMSQLGQQRFLPWHRVYLYELELLLSSDQSIGIPY